MEAINWEEQWSVHAPDFREGAAHFTLQRGAPFKLFPGGGFGDASHPTTQLMLELLEKWAPSLEGKTHQSLFNSKRDWTVFDIGCGSGILSIASARLGASSVYSVDVCEEALSHAQKNAEANNISLCFTPPPALVDLVLMNMISSEQETAWNCFSCPFTALITSGILAEQAPSYTKFAHQQGWKLVETIEKEGWLGFVFTPTPNFLDTTPIF